MEFLMSPFKAYVRWRHSRGFGVHSPFAYTLVKMAVSPGQYGYYGYSLIDNVILRPGFKGYPHAREDARLLLRLLVQLKSRRLLVPEGLPAMCAAAEGAGISCLRFKEGRASSLPKPHPGDFLVATPGMLSTDQLTERLKQGTAILAVSPSEEYIDTIYKACSRGLIFHGVRLLLAVPREEMAFVAYTMKF